MTKKKKIIAVATTFVVAVGIVTSVIIYKNMNKSKQKMMSISDASNELTDFTFGEYDNLKFDCKVQNTDFDNVYTFESDDTGLAGDTEKQELSKLLKTFCGITPDTSEYEQYSDDMWAYTNDGDTENLGYYYTGGTFVAFRIEEDGKNIDNCTVKKIISAYDDYTQPNISTSYNIQLSSDFILKTKKRFVFHS